MNQLIKHRGPNDEGFVFFDDKDYFVLGSDDSAKDIWHSVAQYHPIGRVEDFTKSFNVAFGHRRLSIVDLSVLGHQPMCSYDKRLWIIYNGEIYNYLEIKKELQDYGYNFITDSDTEVVLYAYEKWGTDCQHKFIGMWSFVIYDRIDRSLFASRDRFGIKPLYYYYSADGDFYFASEIKQFTAINDFRPLLNKRRAIDYLYSGITDHTNETLFSGVFIVPPGHFIKLSIDDLLNTQNRSLKFKQWYKIRYTNFNDDFETAKDIYLNKFIESIKLHLRSDVPIGSALSGGIDSSSIVACVNGLLKEKYQQTLQKTFSSCSEYLQYDERIWMDEVIKSFDIEAFFVYPKGEDIFNMTDTIVWYMDEPYQSQSGFLGYNVFAEAKRRNVICLLNGQGGDEILSGYLQFSRIRQKNLLKNLCIGDLLKEIDGLNSILLLAMSMIKDALPIKIRREISHITARVPRLSKLINKEFLSRSIFAKDDLLLNLLTHQSISEHQLLVDPLPRYLRWEDRMSMAHSIEARVPFLDHRLIEFIHSLPLDFLDSPGQAKRIHIEAMQGILPEKVRMRKDKKGFITPERQWFMKDFKNEFIKMFNENIIFSRGFLNESASREYLLNVQRGKIEFDYTYWRIILFCVWMKVFKIELN